MNTFLLDLWHDLRAKRLWPVAVLLVIALVAVPLLLRKDSSPAPATPAASSSSPAVDAAKPVVVADTDTAKNSSLGDFQRKNPFQPARSVLAAQRQQTTATAPQQSTSSSSSSSSQTTTGGSLGGGSHGGGVTSGPPAVSPPQLQQPKTTLFGFTVDVRFGKFGSATVHHGLQALQMLPNQTNPMVVFMGVTVTGDTAVFLLDSKLKAAGEGTCKPSGSTCSFLYLKLSGSKNTEELFKQAADGTGTEYTLELLGIHRVPLSELSKIAKARAAAARKARATKPQVPTPFVVPLDAQLLPVQVAG